ncbi:MAG: class I SAM-dependent methyltransferase [Pedobacter sp.]
MPAERDPASLKTRGRTLDHAASVYDLLAPVMTLGLEGRYRKRAIELLHLRGDEKVLDIGCGTGILTRQLAKVLDGSIDEQAIGIDAAAKMIAVAQRKAAGLANLRFETALAENLPFADASFDAAVSTFFYHHIDRDLKNSSLAELRRVLKPGGRAVIVDVDTPSNLFGKLCAWSGYWLFHQEEIRENIEGQLVEALNAAGFSLVQKVSHHAGHISIFYLEN